MEPVQGRGVMGLRGACVAAFALAGGAWSPALAGGTGDNAVLIVDPTNAESLRAANHYARARGVPASNVLYMAPGASDFADFAGRNVDGLLGTLAQRRIDEHVDFVVVMPGAPFFVSAPGLVSDSCSPVTRFSISTAYTLAPIADEIASGGLRFNNANRYFSAGNEPLGFDAQTGWLGGEPSTSSSAKRYLVGAMLGYTGNRGNTIEEILEMVDRSVASDGTRPAGTFYYMDNQSDAARNVRAGTFPGAAADIIGLGGSAGVLQGVMPAGNHDVLGVMTGAANPNFDANFTMIDGAFADHLTSFAATFNAAAQQKVSAWIRKGASGSHGAVEEPCNYTGKFPRANLHTLYLQGLTLGEAALRSLQFAPYQGLIYGDPLTRPFAYIPEVDVPDAPAGVVSGVVTVNPAGVPTRPGGSMERFDLHVSGVRVDSAGPGQALTVDTTGLADGWHKVTVLGYDDAPTRTAGRWTGDVLVSNHGLTVTIGAGSTQMDLSDVLDVAINGSGAAVEELRLLHNGRVVGSATGYTGIVKVHAQMLGAGKATLVAEATFAGGRVARSAPISVQIEPTGSPVVAQPPVAYGYTRTVVVQEPALLELPATFGDGLGDASWSIVSGPAQAFVHPGPDGPFAVIVPDEGAEGTDTIVFRVTAPSGTSADATINIEYLDLSCPQDLAPPFGVLDIFDVIVFLALFDDGDPRADFAPPFGVLDVFDVIRFLELFEEGCP